MGAQPELHRCKQTVETIRSAAYWRQLCPQLHVASKRFQAAATSCASLPEARQLQLAASIQVRHIPCAAHTTALTAHLHGCVVMVDSTMHRESCPESQGGLAEREVCRSNVARASNGTVCAMSSHLHLH